jgi:hypothetical protein
MKLLDLRLFFIYDTSVQGDAFPVNLKSARGKIMKLAIRIFALSIVVAGAAAATVSSSTPRPISSHQSATARLPIPGCGPHICPPPPPDGN